MKNCLTLALCANASGDYEVKPLLQCHSDSTQPFKSHRIIEHKLQVDTLE